MHQGRAYEKCRLILGLRSIIASSSRHGRVSTNFFDNILDDYRKGKKGERYKWFLVDPDRGWLISIPLKGFLGVRQGSCSIMIW